MSRDETLTTDELRTQLRLIPQGSTVIVHYYSRNSDVRHVAQGTLRFSADQDVWVIEKAQGIKVRLPSGHSSVIRLITTAVGNGDDVEGDPAIGARSLAPSMRRERSASVHRQDLPPPRPQPNAAGPLMTQVPSTVELNPDDRQAQRAKPPSEDVIVSLVAQMKKQSEMIDRLLQQREAPPQPQPQPTSDRRAHAVGGDVATLLSMTDALQGRDVPTWRLAPSLVMPKYLQEKFIIFSIPHLLFRENPTTLMMEKVPCGQAFATYKTMLPTIKMQFPNHIAINFNAGSKSKHDHGMQVMSAEGTAGARAQLERSERMFADLLAKIDAVSIDDLPSSKIEWILYIDAGAAVMEIYATLAFGFNRGGAKVARAYQEHLALGKFDPSKLWPSEDFRVSKE